MPTVSLNLIFTHGWVWRDLCTNKYKRNKAKLFEELGVFFAFSNKQFADKKTGTVWITALYWEPAIVYRKIKRQSLCRRLRDIQEQGRKRLLEEKGIEQNY